MTPGGDEAIGLGFSADGVTWTGYDRDGDGRADPVMTGTHIVGEWDRNYVSRAAILRENSTDYKMWYSGAVENMNYDIGYAVSADGLSWTRAALNPIIYKDDGGSPGLPWRRERTYTPAVVRVGDLYQMWYSGKGDEDYSIGLAFARVAASEPVPEAGSLLMLVGGLACLAGYASLRWRRA